MTTTNHLTTVRGFSSCLILASVGLCGCSSVSDAPFERADVSGTVTLDGELLDEGFVRFVPIEGTTGPKVTAPIDRGLFILPPELGPVIGRHRVEIESTDDGGLAMDDEEALERILAQQGKPRIDIVRVPAAYNKQSTLTAEISAQTPNDFNFQLVSTAR